jgi:multiple antibiotic resistance protein
VNELVKSILLIITALFPIVNPLGNSPIFLSLTQEYGTATRKILARKVAINSFVVLVASFIVGSHILAFFGISIPVVQVGGGLIVISTGWSLLTQKEASEKHGEMQKDVNPLDAFRNAFYPLTLPLTVGPGSISIAVTLGANEPRHFGANALAIAAAIVGSALLAGSIYLCYGFADRLAQALGENGMTIVVRLSSFLLVCIGVQIFWNGMSTLVRSLSLGAG